MSYIKIETANAAEDLEKKLQFLYPTQSRKVIVRVINKTLGIANTQANRAIMKVYNIKLKDLNDPRTKKINKASGVTMSGNISADISPLSLSKFNPVWVHNNAQRFGRTGNFFIRSKGNASEEKLNGNPGDVGVTVEIVKGEKAVLKSAFMLFKYSSTGNTSGLVFARGIYGDAGFRWGVAARLPITKLNTKSVYYALFNNDVERKIYQTIVEYYPKELERIVNLLSKDTNVFNVDNK